MRLTIGIPTLGTRPDRLVQAIRSALGQSTPARVLVSDQDRTGAVAELLRPFAAHPLFRRVESPATCLWENWAHAAESCETELFAWLQDDDLLAPHFAARVAQCLDRAPDCSVYLARLGVSYGYGLANWWQGCGPMVPMDLLGGGPSRIDAGLVVAGGYFTSWALSPGVAFRTSPQTIAAVRACPTDCDLYNERLVLAELAKLGGAVVDPAIVGYWCQHADNESRKQNTAGDGARQARILVEHLDRLIPAFPTWREALAGWGTLLGADPVRHWLRETEGLAGESATLTEARAILAEAAGAPLESTNLMQARREYHRDVLEPLAKAIEDELPAVEARTAPKRERAVSRKAAAAERR